MIGVKEGIDFIVVRNMRERRNCVRLSSAVRCFYEVIGELNLCILI